MADSLQEDTRKHLLSHHGNFESFVQSMVDSHAGRFDEVFWSFLEEHCGIELTKIVDLGTGPGLLLPELSKRFPRTEVWGVEAQPAMCERAAQEVLRCGHSIRLVKHDLTRPGIPGLGPNSVDLSIASMVLHELQSPVQLMDEVHRHLRPGGTWVIYDFARHSLETYMEGKRPEGVEQFQRYSEHCRYSAEDWVWLLERSGFRVEEWILRHTGRHVLIAASKSL